MTITSITRLGIRATPHGALPRAPAQLTVEGGASAVSLLLNTFTVLL